MTTAALVPMFTIHFDIVNGQITFTDQSTNRTLYSSATYGLIKITNMSDGVIVYQHASWNAAPSAWVTPDINGPAGTWAKTAIDMLGYQNVEWKIEYKAYNGIAPASVTAIERSYTLDYTEPTPDHQFTILCSTSQLTSEDNTEYDLVIGGVSYSPTSMTRVKTLTKPAGSSCTISPLTWTDSGSTPSHTIGGGSTAGTRIWTRIWQVNIVSTCLWTLSTWSDDDCGVTLGDTIYVDDDTFVQCNAVICALASCYASMFDRWVTALTSNFSYRENYRDKIIQAQGLFVKLMWYERCGTEVEDVVTALQTLLSGENCNCTTDEDTVSVQVVPWSAIVSGAGTVASTFQFYTETSTPTALDGNNGDIWLYTTTGDIYKKAGGSWTLTGNIKGTAGAAGADSGNKVQTLLNDDTEYSTPAGTAITAISYDFQINNTQFDNANDYIQVTYEVKLAQNDNGKTLTLRFAGTDLLTWFTDDLVGTGNNMVEIILRITPTTAAAQDCFAYLVRGGTPGEVVGPVRIQTAFDLDTTRSVCLYGTNSVASASDIIGVRSIVQYYKRETTLITASGLLGTSSLRSQSFTATEGQTLFTVTAFTPNNYYLPVIDGAIQDRTIVTRSGSVFTVVGGLHAGQVLTIWN